MKAKLLLNLTLWPSTDTSSASIVYFPVLSVHSLAQTEASDTRSKGAHSIVAQDVTLFMIYLLCPWGPRRAKTATATSKAHRLE